MKAEEIYKKLEELGTYQNRKIYIRHGANPDKLFGVSFADINRLVRDIRKAYKKDKTAISELAVKLWETESFDARNLATRLANGEFISKKIAEKMAFDVDNYLHASELAGMLVFSPDVLDLLDEWTSSGKEFVKATGYFLLGALLKEKGDKISDEDVLKYLNKIEKNINSSPNWSKYAMNWALIAVGVYKQKLSDQAVRVAERIGKIEVDHGMTNCKTPDAANYIIKTKKRKK